MCVHETTFKHEPPVVHASVNVLIRLLGWYISLPQKKVRSHYETDSVSALLPAIFSYLISYFPSLFLAFSSFYLHY